MAPDQEHADGDAVVRPMSAGDVDAALAMFSAVAEEGRWLGAEAGFDVAARREAWLAGVDRPGQRSFVAVTPQGDIVGNASATLTPYGVMEVGMAVAAPWRGRGLGGRLLSAVISSAADLGAHKVALQVWPHNEPAIALYRSRGFEVEGRLRRHYRRQSGEIWDAVVMGLVLDES